MWFSKFLPKKYGSRLFWMTFVAGFIPIMIFTILLGMYEREIQPQVRQTIKQVYEEEWALSEDLFQQTIWTLIQQKAVDLATKLDLIIQSHPYMTLEDLQRDQSFRKIAVQTVGQSGYTSLHDSFSGIIRFHADRSLENRSPARIRKVQPSLWSIIEKSIGRNHTSGYYHWTGTKGNTEKRYMYVVPLEQTTADDVRLSIAVSASVDEFTHHITEAQAVHRKTADFLSGRTDTFFVFLKRIGLIYMGIGLLITSLVAFLVGHFFSRAITQLRRATQQVNNGDFDVQIESSMSGEVKTLTDDFNTMVRRLAATTVSKTELEASEARLIEANYGLQREVNTRLLAEKALAAEKERLAVTLGSIRDGVVATDTDGKVVLMNRMAEQLTGWNESEARNKYFEEIFDSVDEETGRKYRDIMQTIVDSERTSPEKTVILSGADGLKKTVTLSGGPIRDKDLTIQGTVIVFRDITEKRMIEEALFRSQKLESVSTLAGGIAHDFNNLMAVILGNISFAKMFVQPTDKAYERLIDAENATLKGKDLTYKLLTFSRIGESSKTVTSLEGIIRQSAHLGLTDSQVECTFVFPDNLPHVKIDENQVQQVIYNLVMNAKETMSCGGQIAITAESTLLGPDAKTPLQSGHYVKISIEDHGSGIPAEDMSRIFDPYFTTKEVSNIKGTGLGLAICHGIIRDHGGFMTVDSKPGIGTTVHVYVPVNEERDSDLQKQQTTGEPLRVLLMDDQCAVQQIAAELLSHVGYKVELASEGSQAIRMYMEAFKSGKPFDVVIMDLIIPDGMGGAETVRKLREFDPAVKAIATSGNTNDKIMVRFKEYGFSAVIAKPFSFEEIVMTIESTIADRPKIFAQPVPR